MNSPKIKAALEHLEQTACAYVAAEREAAEAEYESDYCRMPRNDYSKHLRQIEKTESIRLQRAALKYTRELLTSIKLLDGGVQMKIINQAMSTLDDYVAVFDDMLKRRT
jgi:hypothetical protein